MLVTPTYLGGDLRIESVDLMTEREPDFQIRLPARPGTHPLLCAFLASALDVTGIQDPGRVRSVVADCLQLIERNRDRHMRATPGRPRGLRRA